MSDQIEKIAKACWDCLDHTLEQGLEESVLSISDEPDEPENFRLGDGMVIIRFWTGGRTWEFCSGKGGGWVAGHPDIRGLGRMVGEFSKKAGPIGGAVTIAVAEFPGKFFIPRPHHAFFQNGENRYLLEEDGQAGGGVRWLPEISTVLPYPGVLEVVGEAEIQILKRHPGFVGENEFAERVPGAFRNNGRRPETHAETRDRIHSIVSTIDVGGGN